MLAHLFDPALITTGLLVGFLVGLTGMGGGALLTPLLVLVFGVPPLAAVSSDLVTSLFMKPFGAAVHWRHATVQVQLLKWLALGAVPAGFLGAVLIGTLSHGGYAEAVQSGLKVLIAVALIASILGTAARIWTEPYLVALQGAQAGSPGDGSDPVITVRPLRTVLIGVIGGLAVGLTSVGAGSLIIAMLLLAYPLMSPRQLVGTDIVQAIPLVGAAALGHLLFGDVQLTITASLLLGAIPAVIVGARVSATAPTRVVRPVVAAVLFASALALLSVPTPTVVLGGIAVGVVIVVSQAVTAARLSARARSES